MPEDLILKAIELATWAPNGGNHQNWKFMIITKRHLIHLMADAVQSKIDMITCWPEAIRFSESIESWKKNGSFFRNAPVCIAVLMANYESLADKILKLRIESDQSAQTVIEARRVGNSGLQSVASAIGYLMLVLHSEGLGGVWMTGPLLAKAEIEELLSVPKELNFVALIPIGIPEEEPIKTRKPLSEVVEFRR